MDVLFLGCLYSEHLKTNYKNNSIRGYQFASQNLQESLIDGFIQNGVRVKVLTIPSLSSFPRSYRKPIVNNASFYFGSQVIGDSLGYINLPLNRILLRNPCQYVRKWYENTSGEKVIFVYGMHKQIMKIALEAKKQYRDIKLSIIVPDLPQYFGWNKYLLFLKQDRKAIKELNFLINDFEYVVVLSQYMLEKLNLSNNCKSIVMEGIFSPEEKVANVSKDKNIAILYTGNISRRYGIEQLLNAFKKINNPNFRLWIRGNGDMLGAIKERMASDNRIVLIPPMSKKELLELQKKATLLVNPTSTNQDFTRFFFPSKTMDYLASGTPTLMYKLHCIPEEYNDYLFFFTGETDDSMAKDIISVSSISPSILQECGEKSMNFILKEKNSKFQVSKIIHLLNK